MEEEATAMAAPPDAYAAFEHPPGWDQWSKETKRHATEKWSGGRQGRLGGVCDSGPATDIGVSMGNCMVPRYDRVAHYLTSVDINILQSFSMRSSGCNAKPSQVVTPQIS